MILLEAYTSLRPQYKTGGPPAADMMLNVKSSSSELISLKFLRLQEYVREIHEGEFHNGPGAVVQALARISHQAAQDTDKTLAFWSKAWIVKNTVCYSSMPITVQAGLRVRKLALHSNRSYCYAPQKNRKLSSPCHFFATGISTAQTPGQEIIKGVVGGMITTLTNLHN